MTFGVVMLVHTALPRAEQAIRQWVKGGCPVVVHVDQKVCADDYMSFVDGLSDLRQVQFSKRFNCEWGTWALVAATQDAASKMITAYPDVGHVYLASGACLPLRPVKDLGAYLAARPSTDFIESSTTADVPWTVGGLEQERFTLRFPFAWRRHRNMFDFYVRLQQLIGVRRRVPAGLEPHIGSQWWCLTRKTLTAILNDPKKPIYDRYFRRVWIPDESYFQTLVRVHSTQVESRSLTLSKFDHQGKPHIFYDDHKMLLCRSKAFVARKIWPRADVIYDSFPITTGALPENSLPDPAAVDRIFTKAVTRRTQGRTGLYMQSRFPTIDRENTVTATSYSLLQGFAEIFEGFEPWLAKATGATVHGHLFAPDAAHFSGEETLHAGGLSSNPHLRDYNPKMFLTNLLWNARDQRQAFQFGPADTQSINWMVAKDINARIYVVSGAWLIPLFKEQRAFSDLRREAARLQLIENQHLKVLQSPFAKAHIRIQTLADFLQSPMTTVQQIVDEMNDKPRARLQEAPNMVDLDGFGAFLQHLRNQGMHPILAGTFPTDPDSGIPQSYSQKPYLVR